ncbi:tRNA (uridine(34)/cytosine(34)/5-carboxymethylaminomethyluridine(34)-2'-O)-methyltransferase TrmL [bacterium]|nr:tRNA (uridine(34)/cytosine(34)/5-carboxymethylaminomethyluridine(34)-2'-O)-methyltransferase TrmL [bacterium]
MSSNFNVVLFEPEIPQNTGNIARMCACTNCKLYLVGKLGFSMSDKYMKRSGLDYWESVEVIKKTSLEELIEENQNSNFYLLTTKGKKKYTDVQFQKGDFFVFGPETRGLPEDLIFSNFDKAITIPMQEGQRSLNLSNSAAIVVYEGVRQLNLL